MYKIVFSFALKTITIQDSIWRCAIMIYDYNVYKKHVFEAAVQKNWQQVRAIDVQRYIAVQWYD